MNGQDSTNDAGASQGSAGRAQAVHSAAGSGYSAEADTYRRVRPSYHPDLIARFADRYSAGRVVEIGAGTGIFTAAIVGAIVGAGTRVLAVEPVAAMRAHLEKLPIDDAGRVPPSVAAGTAESIPTGDGSADTVVAAQAFHWFDHGPALDEIARVLRPGGHLVTAWNVRDLGTPWVAEVTAIMEPFAAGTPRHHSMIWRRAIDDDPRFEPVDDWSTPNPVPTSAEGVVGRTLSTSFIAALDDDRQAAVIDAVRAVVEPLGPDFDYPYVSELQAWRFTGER